MWRSCAYLIASSAARVLHEQFRCCVELGRQLFCFCFLFFFPTPITRPRNKQMSKELSFKKKETKITKKGQFIRRCVLGKQSRDVHVYGTFFSINKSRRFFSIRIWPTKIRKNAELSIYPLMMDSYIESPAIAHILLKKVKRGASRQMIVINTAHTSFLFDFILDLCVLRYARPHCCAVY